MLPTRIARLSNSSVRSCVRCPRARSLPRLFPRATETPAELPLIRCERMDYDNHDLETLDLQASWPARQSRARRASQFSQRGKGCLQILSRYQPYSRHVIISAEA